MYNIVERNKSNQISCMDQVTSNIRNDDWNCSVERFLDVYEKPRINYCLSRLFLFYVQQ